MWILESSTGEALRTALREHGIYADVVPHWLPEGFKLTNEVSVYDLNYSKALEFSAVYSDNESYYVISIVRHIDVDFQRAYEKTSLSPDFYTTNGIRHYVFANTDSTTLAWNVDGLECSIITNHPDEIIKVVDSIYEE